MRTIAVVTTSRADYSVYRPLLRRLAAAPDFRLMLFVSGMHLLSDFGLTIKEIEEDGFDIHARVEMPVCSDTPEAIAQAMGWVTSRFGEVLAAHRPDILVVLGDRFEMHAAAVAAVPFLVPIAHIAGGALTEGAFDDAFRHAITKISHLHFVETEVYAARIVQMGEEPWRVTVSGALALDNLRGMHFYTWDELVQRYGLPNYPAPLLVTFHPVTRSYRKTEEYIHNLLAALRRFDLPIIFTYPNADTGGRAVLSRIQEFVCRRPNACVVANFGPRGYFSLMCHAAAMVGNSSSGIVEAASFRLPVVNIGTRQSGRISAKNVIHVGYGVGEIADGIARAISQKFRDHLADLVNPYGDGCATERILKVLGTVEIDDRLLVKKFHDVAC